MTTSIRNQIISQFCVLAEASKAGVRAGVEWHPALQKLVFLIMGYTHEGVSCMEALNSDCMYGPDFNKASEEAAEAILALHATTDKDTSEGEVLWFAKRRFVRVLKVLSFVNVAEMVESSQSTGTHPERVPFRV